MFDLLSRLPLSFTPTVLNQGTSDIESPSTREEAGVDLVSSRLLLKRNSVRRWTMCFPVPARPRVLAWSENGSCQAEDPAWQFSQFTLWYSVKLYYRGQLWAADVMSQHYFQTMMLSWWKNKFLFGYSYSVNKVIILEGILSIMIRLVSFFF